MPTVTRDQAVGAANLQRILGGGKRQYLYLSTSSCVSICTFLLPIYLQSLAAGKNTLSTLEQSSIQSSRVFGAGVGVGAKRHSDSPLGRGACDVLCLDEKPNGVEGSGMEVVGKGGGGLSRSGVQLEEGECKRARLAGRYHKEVLLVFDGDLSTCDRAVINSKLQSLKRLLIKRHDSARAPPPAVEADADTVRMRV